MAEQLGRYLLTESIGVGGMAEVFRATLQGPMGFAKEVAIKRVPPHLIEDTDNIRSLVNEARIGALLRHRNIVEVYELDQADGSWFVAMEMVRGRTLTALLRRCRATGTFLPRCIVLEIAAQIAAGLHYAHTFRDKQGNEIGLIHRDLKPANVMVSDRAIVKVMDFGIARSSTNYYKTSLGGPIKGTPLYMSPEQLRREQVTHLSDLFSFGVVLYEMLTNCRLFLAPNPTAVMSRLLDMDLAPYFEPITDVDPDLGDLLTRCLDRDPPRRPASAKHLQDDLLAIRHGLGPAPDLAEFTHYLQSAPDAKLVEVDGDDPWAWTPKEALLSSEPVAKLRVDRTLEEIGADFRQFGPGFFGPVLFPDADTRDLEAARRSSIPRYGAFLCDATQGDDGPNVNTQVATRVFGGDPCPEPPATGPSTPRPGASGPARMGGRNLRGIVAAFAVVVLLAALGGTALRLARRSLPARVLEDYTDAVEKGDWRTAAAVAASAHDHASEPAGRLLLAMDAALAGRDSEAVRHLGAPDDLPEPLRSRGHVLLGALERTKGAGGEYVAAIAAYERALECTGTDCTTALDAAREGLVRCCVVLDDPLPEGCQRMKAAWASDGEGLLVRSGVLLDDGHTREATDTLVAALASIHSASECGCTGLSVLRSWASRGELSPGSELARELAAVGLSAAREPADCELFASLNDG